MMNAEMIEYIFLNLSFNASFRINLVKIAVELDIPFE